MRNVRVPQTDFRANGQVTNQARITYASEKSPVQIGSSSQLNEQLGGWDYQRQWH